MARKIKFNTGRPYSPDGQLIFAQEVGVAEGGLPLVDVQFWDKTRGISGRVTVGFCDPRDIMEAYDKGRYVDEPCVIHEADHIRVPFTVY